MDETPTLNIQMDETPTFKIIDETPTFQWTNPQYSNRRNLPVQMDEKQCDIY
jgi:hypothetical protein